MRRAVEANNSKAKYNDAYSDQHEDIIRFCESKMRVVHIQYNSSNDMFKYLLTACRVLKTESRTPIRSNEPKRPYNKL